MDPPALLHAKSCNPKSGSSKDFNASKLKLLRSKAPATEEGTPKWWRHGRHIGPRCAPNLYCRRGLNSSQYYGHILSVAKVSGTSDLYQNDLGNYLALYPSGSKYLNMKYLPQTLVIITDYRNTDTPDLGILDP